MGLTAASRYGCPRVPVGTQLNHVSTRRPQMWWAHSVHRRTYSRACGIVWLHKQVKCVVCVLAIKERARNNGPKGHCHIQNLRLYNCRSVANMTIYTHFIDETRKFSGPRKQVHNPQTEGDSISEGVCSNRRVPGPQGRM